MYVCDGQDGFYMGMSTIVLSLLFYNRSRRFYITFSSLKFSALALPSSLVEDILKTTSKAVQNFAE